jgi:hypothetical protein
MSAVRDIQTPGYSRLVFDLPKKVEFKVGILAKDGAKDDGGLTVAELATMHEFGGSRETSKGPMPPRRSFIRDWFDEEVDQVRELLLTQFLRTRAGARPSIISEQLALKFRAMMQNRITRRIPPPNADSTIRQKTRKGKKDVPLVDTGILKSSIDCVAEVSL